MKLTDSPKDHSIFEHAAFREAEFAPALDLTMWTLIVQGVLQGSVSAAVHENFERSQGYYLMAAELVAKLRELGWRPLDDSTRQLINRTGNDIATLLPRSGCPDAPPWNPIP
jgi:hypothetical protein